MLSNVYVVFEPEQIKSATDNKGALDPENAGIINEPKSAKELNAHIKTRPATTQTQLTLGFDAFINLGRKILGLHTNRIGAGLIGSRIFKDFQAGQPTQLVGQKIQRPSDLAVLAQVYRDPL